MVLVVGHRGARGEAPENTLAGFGHALRAGVVALELDVRLSADGELVVIHDATVGRTTGATGSVAELTAAQLAALDARAAFPDWPAPPDQSAVPRLADVLDAFAAVGRCFAIEIKSDTPERLERVSVALATLIERYRLLGRVTVTSFDPVALDLMRGRAPAVPRAYIGAYNTPAFLETALRLGCRQADVPLKTGSKEAVRQAQARGLRVVGWLGNTPDDLAALLDWGVDGITSDYPTRALAFLRTHGRSGAHPGASA
jgi:glycerophosphoryl diester phosphodiesterase